MAYDAVIIGAGHNGLAAGVHLAARGKRVAVVEAKDEPGGAVKTRDLTLPGFRHDLCAMNLSMFAGSGFFAAHKDALLAHGLAFVPAEHAFATVFRDGTYLGVSRTLETTLAGISALSPADAKGWRDLLAHGSARMRPTSSRSSVRPCPRSRPPGSCGRRGGRWARTGSTTP